MHGRALEYLLVHRQDCECLGIYLCVFERQDLFGIIPVTAVGFVS